MRRGMCGVLIGALAILAIVQAADADKRHGKRNHFRAAAARLRTFDDCGSVIDYGSAHARKIFRGSYPPTTMPPYPDRTTQGETTSTVGASGQAGAGKGAPGVDFSATNVQEQNVDEPDIVKTDGATIFAIGGNSLHAIDAQSPNPALLDSLRLQGFSHEILLVGDRILVISQK